MMSPFVTCPSHAPLTHYGSDADGGKWICAVEHLQKGCVIYSLGSNLQYDFEEAMLAATPCEIHTYDCTADGKSLGDRHFYHKTCIGNANSNYITLDKAMADNGNPSIDLLKVDIEGWEWELFRAWKEDSVALPYQISFEVHSEFPKVGHEMTRLDTALLFYHLANLGYGIVSKEVNTVGVFDQTQNYCCSEFTMVRIEGKVVK